MKYFNINGICYPEEHFMVNITDRLAEIKSLVDKKQYFVINRARQYGKTTTLHQLVKYLSDDYNVFFISLEGLGDSAFISEKNFCNTICRLLCDTVLYHEVPKLDDIIEGMFLDKKIYNEITDMQSLGAWMSEFCEKAKKPVILMIDEVDQASNYRAFLDFLGMLRSKYLKRTTRPVFHSVILAGVYDIKNLKHKIREEQKHQYNSPWNIAADFKVDMSFDIHEISCMLEEYAREKMYKMDTETVAKEIYDYTSGYPYLVSKICKLLDENVRSLSVENKWTSSGVTEAVKLLLKETNTLFDDMRKKITDYPELKEMLCAILLKGENFSYNPDNFVIDVGTMFGFLKEIDGQVAIANRIFETRLYNLFLSEEMSGNITYQLGERNKNQFVKNGVLDMKLVLEKFMMHFQEIYGCNQDKFVEENGRRLFLLYLKPIINGTGNYYIEAQTRNQTRTDIIVDYLGKQYVIELKIWHGEEYNRRGERQLIEYLDYYQLDYGYMISFNFNKNKKTGIKNIEIGDRNIFEVIV